MMNAECGMMNKRRPVFYSSLIIHHSSLLLFGVAVPVTLLLLLCLLAPAVWAQGPPQAAATPKEPARPKGWLAGRVTTEDGQPVANARVSAEARRSEGDTSGTGVTGPDGRFRIEKLERGAYSVYGLAPAHFDASYLEYERGVRVFHQLGDTINITLMKGGVITGRVTDAKGEPVMGTRVNLVRVRTLGGRPVREVNRFMRSLERLTDDRGVFRSYGLLPGVYVVSAGGPLSTGYSSTSHAVEAPTFYPSATRDNATEITVRAGEETANVDIRLRHDEGHAVSGTVEGVGDAAHAEFSTNLRLITASNTEHQGLTIFYGRATTGEGFAFEGLTDGDYDLVAERRTMKGGTIIAGAERRVSVRGEDVKGLRIKLAPLGSLSGRVVLENPPAGGASAAATTKDASACREKPDALLDGAVIIARRAGAKGSRADAAPAAATIAREPSTLEAVPNEKGEFVFRGLRGGAYRLDVRLGESFYVRSVKQTGTAAATRAPQQSPPPLVVDAVQVRAGENVSGILVTAVYGAATLRGRVNALNEGAASPSPPRPEHSRVHLVPQERERAEDPARYAEATTADDGTFEFGPVAPGRYWLVARPSPPVAPADEVAPSSPAPLTDAERGRLRREAEAAANSVTLAPCQSVNDYVLRLAPPKD